MGQEREVSEIVQVGPGRALRACFLDGPVPETRGSELDVYGWAIGRYQTVARIEVFAGQSLVTRSSLNKTRPDLAAVFPDVPHATRAGFRLTVDAAALPQGEELRVEAILEDGSRARVGYVRLNDTDQCEQELRAPEGPGFPATPHRS